MVKSRAQGCPPLNKGVGGRLRSLFPCFPPGTGFAPSHLIVKETAMKKSDVVSETMSKSNGHVLTKSEGCPRQGDRYRCPACGMEIEVHQGCACKECETTAHFQCCGQELQSMRA